MISPKRSLRWVRSIHNHCLPLQPQVPLLAILDASDIANFCKSKTVTSTMMTTMAHYAFPGPSLNLNILSCNGNFWIIEHGFIKNISCHLGQLTFVTRKLSGNVGHKRDVNGVQLTGKLGGPLGSNKSYKKVFAEIHPENNFRKPSGYTFNKR